MSLTDRESEMTNQTSAGNILGTMRVAQGMIVGCLQANAILLSYPEDVPSSRYSR